MNAFTQNIDPEISSSSNGKAMKLPKCAISRWALSRNEEGLLSNLGIKTPLSKVPILGDILF